MTWTVETGIVRTVAVLVYGEVVVLVENFVFSQVSVTLNLLVLVMVVVIDVLAATVVSVVVVSLIKSVLVEVGALPPVSLVTVVVVNGLVVIVLVAVVALVELAVKKQSCTKLVSVVTRRCDQNTHSSLRAARLSEPPDLA